MRLKAMTTATVLTALVAVAGLEWVLGRPALARRHDVAVRRSLYRSFPRFLEQSKPASAPSN